MLVHGYHKVTEELPPQANHTGHRVGARIPQGNSSYHLKPTTLGIVLVHGYHKVTVELPPQANHTGHRVGARIPQGRNIDDIGFHTFFFSVAFFVYFFIFLYCFFIICIFTIIRLLVHGCHKVTAHE